MKKIDIRFSVLALFIFLTAFSRLIIPIGNFSPLGAIALFGGAYFNDRTKAFSLPLIALFLSDMVIQGVMYHGQYGFPLYNGWYWVYGTFALIVIVGKWFIKRVSVSSVLLSSATVAIAHWIITDFGIWLVGCTDISTGQLYTHDFNGLFKCYVLALPYLKDFFIGTAMYSAVLFGAFEWAQHRYPVLAPTKVV